MMQTGTVRRASRIRRRHIIAPPRAAKAPVKAADRAIPPTSVIRFDDYGSGRTISKSSARGFAPANARQAVR
jgi:hypothetical protein